METAVYIISAICMVVGFIGSFVPVLPGPPVSYVGILLLHFFTPDKFSTSFLITLLAVVIVVQVLDYIVPTLGSKYIGGSEHGSRGCMAGTLIGLFFLPLGIILGPFMGAVIGELLSGKKLSYAIVSGIGSFLGFLTGVLLKVVLSGYFIYKFIQAVFF